MRETRHKMANSDYLQWKTTFPSKEDGVIVGCSASHEWLLPWWWMNYALNNNHPVTFIDFGDMTHAAKEWCKKRGGLEKLDIQLDRFIIQKNAIHPSYHDSWVRSLDFDIWSLRQGWFKKPFACLASPYRRTIWIDIDCQVRGSIEGGFHYCENSSGLAILHQPIKVHLDNVESGRSFENETEYNSGVIVYNREVKLLGEWAKGCLERNSELRGDQEVLSRVAYEKGIQLPMLPKEYNWVWQWGELEKAVIIHWSGAGQTLLKEQIQILKHFLAMDLKI